MAESTPPPPPLPLAGRTAIVTGASGGIGRAIALHLSSLGANLVLGYATSSAKADLLAADINASPSPSPSRAIAARSDVSDPAAADLLFSLAEDTFASPAHILVTAAGVLDPNYPTLAATSDEDWDRTFQVNAKGAFLFCREAARRLKRGGGGRIVTVTSSTASAPPAGYGAYAASKAAVEAMTRALAKEVGADGITANCVAPGPVATEMFYAGKSEEMVRRIAAGNPMGRIPDAAEVAPVVGFLCTDAAGWVNGQVIRVNGGYV